MEHKDVFAQVRFAAEKMQKINLFETRNFFCDVYCLAPGQEQKAHAHAHEDKLYYVLTGRATFQVDEVQQELGAHELIFAPAGSVHGVVNTTASQTTLLVFMTPNPNVK